MTTKTKQEGTQIIVSVFRKRKFQDKWNAVLLQCINRK